MPIRFLKPDKAVSHFHFGNLRSRDMSKAFSDLLESMPASDDSGGDVLALSTTGDYSKVYNVSESQQVAVKQLYETIEHSLRVSYKNGEEKGKQLLCNLAKGDITLKEFEL